MELAQLPGHKLKSAQGSRLGEAAAGYKLHTVKSRVYMLESSAQRTGLLAIDGGVDCGAAGDAGLVGQSSLCVEDLMSVTAVFMVVALCADTSSHGRGHSKKSSLHVEQVIRLQLL